MGRSTLRMETCSGELGHFPGSQPSPLTCLEKNALQIDG